MRTHTCDYPHKFGVCDKGFSRLDHLQNHTKTHSGDKSHIGDKVENGNDVCVKKFIKLGILKVHMRTHTDDAPHIGDAKTHDNTYCDVGSKCFSYIRNVQRHMRTHTVMLEVNVLVILEMHRDT
ncbi:zinc finger protein 596-like [Mytilus edulis]|uniref:zinc finger protein 596-like n=1 Tax=Mytilus edulis TaxID=6550 RepID=UPI0039F136B8